MTRISAIPTGFEASEVGGGTLILARRHADAIRRQGLDDPRAWSDLLRGRISAAGRGATARVELPDGPRVVLKQMRRGGLAARLWRDRYPGSSRLLDNLRLPLEAACRGVATAPPVALLLLPGPPGFHRAWMAFEEIAGAVDLAQRLASEAPPTQAELAAVVALVRGMHDAGVDHRDLNLGNLLLRTAPGGVPEAFVIDLDRAKLYPAPLGFRRRQRALRRLARSHVKRIGPDVDSDVWLRLYAADDPILTDRLERGRAAGRLWLFLHSLGWRR